MGVYDTHNSQFGEVNEGSFQRLLDAPVMSFLDEVNGGTTQAPPPEKRSAMGEIWSQLKAGAFSDLPRMAGRAMQYVSNPGNRCLVTRSRSAADWEQLRNSASHWHRQDVDQLDTLHYEYDNDRHLFQPDSPTFAEYATSKGLSPYNLDVTIENITQPKER